MTYAEWLKEQGPDLARASLRHLRVCRLLGIAERRYPFSARAEKLRAEVRRYYREWDQ